MNIRTLKIFAKASLTTLVSLGVVQFSANAADPIEMLDVTAAVGLDNDFFYSDTGHSLGVIWFDFNNDGYPDILATNGYDDGSGMSLRPHLYLMTGEVVLETRTPCYLTFQIMIMPAQ